MTKNYEFDFIGFAPEYGTTPPIPADSMEHAEFKALAYIAETFPELQEVSLTESRTA